MWKQLNALSSFGFIYFRLHSINKKWFVDFNSVEWWKNALKCVIETGFFSAISFLFLNFFEVFFQSVFFRQRLKKKKNVWHKSIFIKIVSEWILRSTDRKQCQLMIPFNSIRNFCFLSYNWLVWMANERIPDNPLDINEWSSVYKCCSKFNLNWLNCTASHTHKTRFFLGQIYIFLHPR